MFMIYMYFRTLQLSNKYRSTLKIKMLGLVLFKINHITGDLEQKLFTYCGDMNSDLNSKSLLWYEEL